MSLRRGDRLAVSRHALAVVAGAAAAMLASPAVAQGTAAARHATVDGQAYRLAQTVFPVEAVHVAFASAAARDLADAFSNEPAFVDAETHFPGTGDKALKAALARLDELYVPDVEAPFIAAVADHLDSQMSPADVAASNAFLETTPGVAYAHVFADSLDPAAAEAAFAALSPADRTALDAFRQSPAGTKLRAALETIPALLHPLAPSLLAKLRPQLLAAATREVANAAIAGTPSAAPEKKP